MRIALVVFPAGKHTAGDPLLAASLARGMESMGHRTDILDRDGLGRLPGYDYLVFLAEPLSFFSGKIPAAARDAFSHSGGLGRKKGAAFIKKKGLFSSRALSRLMALMEKEGIIVNWSDFVLGQAQAEALGKRIGA